MKTLYRKNRKGFTLIEALVATVLIGIAIASLIVSGVSNSQANGFGMELSTAEFLIDEIKELTAALPVVDPNTTTETFGAESGETGLSAYDDLDDFDGKTFSPPVDMAGNSLSDFSAFSQVVTVVNVSPSNFANTVADHGSSFVKVTVGIQLNNRAISSSSWIRALR